MGRRRIRRSRNSSPSMRGISTSSVSTSGFRLLDQVARHQRVEARAHHFHVRLAVDDLGHQAADQRGVVHAQHLDLRSAVISGLYVILRSAHLAVACSALNISTLPRAGAFAAGGRRSAAALLALHAYRIVLPASACAPATLPLAREVVDASRVVAAQVLRRHADLLRSSGSFSTKSALRSPMLSSRHVGQHRAAAKNLGFQPLAPGAHLQQFVDAALPSRRSRSASRRTACGPARRRRRPAA